MIITIFEVKGDRNMHKHDLIVIGASAGGVEALINIVRELPADLRATVFIVLHIARQGTSMLPEILSRAGNLPATFPQSGQIFEQGNIYVAPNDRHLLIKDGYMTLTTGPRENGFRPSIDSLFRTAANMYGSRVVGVILTGLLDNGSAGIANIKEQGGIAIVQEPSDAMFSSMPENALKVIKADYILPLSQIPQILVELTMTDADEQANETIGEDPAESGEANYIYQRDEGLVSDIACPECGGVLVEYKSGKDKQLVRFECRVGHRYSLQSMQQHHSEKAEAALWAAVRSLEENITISHRMIESAIKLNNEISKEFYEEKIEETKQHADIIRQILLGK